MADEINKDKVLAASFKALARYLGTEGALKIIFPELYEAAKDKQAVKKLLGTVSGLDNDQLNQLESEYVDAKAIAEKQGLYNNEDWAPVRWRHFQFDQKLVLDHNDKMKALLDDVVEQCHLLSQELPNEARLKMYMHGLAAHHVQNYINSLPRGNPLGNFGGH